MIPFLATLAFGFTPCPDGPEGFECDEYAVPLDRAEPNGPTVSLAVRRMPAPVQPARGQLWFVTGGPGDSGTADLANLEGFHGLVDDLDLYAFDPRGTGGSDRLTCPDQEAPDSQDGVEVVEDEWPACMRHVRASHRWKLPHFTTPNAAADLAELVDHHRDGETWLWGVSYGTLLVQRALVDRPALVDGVVLDGLVPVDWGFTEFDRGLDTVARRYLETCTEDDDCAEALGPDPAAFAETLLDDLEAGHCARLGVTADIQRLLNGVFLMGGAEYAPLMGPVMRRMARCKPRDVGAMVRLFDALFPEEGGALAERPSHSPALQRHVAYSDMWGTTPPLADLEADIDRAIATTEVTLNFATLADEWPVAPPDPLAGVAPAPQMPVLLLHGGLDPTMPLERVAGMADGWPDATFVPVPTAHHVTFNDGDCPQGMTADFLYGRSVDASCVDEMADPSWTIDEELADAIFLGDPWGTRTCGHTPGAAWLALLPLAALRRRGYVRGDAECPRPNPTTGGAR